MIYLPYILLLGLLALLNFSEARLTVKSPDSLADKFDEINGIDYAVLTPQNKITYQKAFIGNLVLSNPENGCETIRFNREDVTNPILLIDWGECHYPQKIKNAEVAGVTMVILILKNDMPINHPAIKQTPLDTKLEVLAVSKTDGDILKAFLEENQIKDVNDPDRLVELTYSFDVERHTSYRKADKIIVDFWLTAADATGQAFEFIEDFADTMRKFGDQIEFHPHYVLWECKKCIVSSIKKRYDTRCISEGRYCDPEPFINRRISGAYGVVESLRQMAFRDKSPKVTVDGDWWRYTVNFGKECVGVDAGELDDCRQKIYDTQDIYEETVLAVEDIMKRSFVSEPSMLKPRSLYMDNTILQKELELLNEMHVDHYPALYINKEKYTGSFRDILSIEELICSNFVKVPSVCGKNIAEGNADTAAPDTAVYVAVFIVSIILMALMVYCVRRSVRRQVMGRMNDEIMTQYKQFKDKASTLGDESI